MPVDARECLLTFLINCLGSSPCIWLLVALYRAVGLFDSRLSRSDPLVSYRRVTSFISSLSLLPLSRGGPLCRVAGKLPCFPLGLGFLPNQ